MAQTKKMALVEPRLLEGLLQATSSPYPVPSTVKALNTLDGDMSAILKNAALSNEEKIQQYQHVLQRYLTFQDQYNQGQPPPLSVRENNNKDRIVSPNTIQKEAESTPPYRYLPPIWSDMKDDRTPVVMKGTPGTPGTPLKRTPSTPRRPPPLRPLTSLRQRLTTPPKKKRVVSTKAGVKTGRRVRRPGLRSSPSMTKPQRWSPY